MVPPVGDHHSQGTLWVHPHLRVLLGRSPPSAPPPPPPEEQGEGGHRGGVSGLKGCWGIGVTHGCLGVCLGALGGVSVSPRGQAPMGAQGGRRWGGFKVMRLGGGGFGGSLG